MEFLKSVVEVWEKQLALCKTHKAKHFGDTARRLSDFLGKSYREIYIDTKDRDLKIAGMEDAFYKPRINKTREFVSVVTPFVHAKVPERVVTPRRPPLPPELLSVAGLEESHAQASAQDKAMAFLAQWWLNYIPGECGAKRQQRMMIEECLVKGRGVGWHEMVDGPTGEIPGTFFDTVDNLYVDPDAKLWRDAGYIIRQREWPAWRLADLFKIPVERLRGTRQSAAQRATDDSGAVGDPTNDICVWYEVSSRIGIGHKLHEASEELKNFKEAMDSVGKHVYLPFLPGLDYPLSLPPEITEAAPPEEIQARLEWPVAFFEEPSNPFPCTPMDIYPNTNDAWATSPLEGSLSLQICLDQLYALMIGRVRTTCRDIHLVSKAVSAAVRTAILTGGDQEVVDVEGEVVDMKSLLHTIQFPEINTDLWRIIPYMERAFEQATGMTPLMYGSGGDTQIRSAEEVSVRQANVTSRPNDYADAIEEWNAQVAAKELQMSRLYVTPQTVAPLFRESASDGEGEPIPPEDYEPLTKLWASLINTPDPAEAAADLHCTTEAGSGRRKNRQKMTQDLQAVGQIVLPALQAFATAGMPDPFNNFMDIVAEVYEMPMGRLKLPAMNLEPPEEEEEEEEVDEADENQKDRDASLHELLLTLEVKLKEARIKASATKNRGGD